MEGFGARAPLHVLEISWLVPGVRFCMVFVLATGSFFRRFWVPVFLRSLSPSISFSSSSFSSGGRPGCPFFASLRLLAGYRTPSTWTSGSSWLHMFFFCSLCLPGSAAVPPLFSLLLPSLSLSLFIYLFFFFSLSFLRTSIENR